MFQINILIMIHLGLCKNFESKFLQSLSYGMNMRQKSFPEEYDDHLIIGIPVNFE